jgi:general secretion pathway protein J
LPPSPSIEWNGRVLRSPAQQPGPADGALRGRLDAAAGAVAALAVPPLQTRGDLESAWLDADLWSRNPSDAMRRQEVAIGPLQDWQIFYFRENAWSNPQSTSAGPRRQPPRPRPRRRADCPTACGWCCSCLPVARSAAGCSATGCARR